MNKQDREFVGFAAFLALLGIANKVQQQESIQAYQEARINYLEQRLAVVEKEKLSIPDFRKIVAAALLKLSRKETKQPDHRFIQ